MNAFRDIGKDKAPPDAKALVDLPLADPLKLYVHPGLRPKVKRGPRAQYHDDIGGKLTRNQVNEMKEAERSAKYGKLFDYYATTDIPFERIAKHVGLELWQVGRAMKDRGRLS